MRPKDNDEIIIMITTNGLPISSKVISVCLYSDKEF